MNARSKGNPFARSEHYWKVTFTIPSGAAGTAEASFDDVALAVSGFETDEANKIWTFELLTEDKDAVQWRTKFMAHIGEEFGLVLRSQR